MHCWIVNCWIMCCKLDKPLIKPDSTTTTFSKTGIHSMLGWRATTRHGVTKKEAQKD